MNRPANLDWLEGIRGRGVGNVAKLEGSVEKTTKSTLFQLLDLGDDYGNSHYLYPR